MELLEKQIYKSDIITSGAFEPVGIWHKTRASFILKYIKKYKDPTEPYTALDIGAGNAYFPSFASTQTKWSFTCYDPEYPTKLKELNGIKILNQIPQTKFDIIFALDVLEHIENEEKTLSIMYNLLKPGGSLVITVPLWPTLISTHDRILGHHRRYNEKEICSTFTKMNFATQFQTQFFFFPLIFRYLEKRINFYKSKELNCRPYLKVFLDIDILVLSAFLKLKVKYLGLSWIGIFKKEISEYGSHTFH